MGAPDDGERHRDGLRAPAPPRVPGRPQPGFPDAGPPPKMAATPSGSPPRPPAPPKARLGPEVEVEAEVRGRCRCLETAGALSPWRPGRSPNEIRVMGGEGPRMGPGGPGWADQCRRRLRRGGRLGSPGASRSCASRARRPGAGLVQAGVRDRGLLDQLPDVPHSTTKHTGKTPPGRTASAGTPSQTPGGQGVGGFGASGRAFCFPLASDPVSHPLLPRFRCHGVRGGPRRESERAAAVGALPPGGAGGQHPHAKGQSHWPAPR